MKLLGWMHRKFRQGGGGGDVFKDVAGGGSCNCLSGRSSAEDERPQLGRRPRRHSDALLSRSLRLAEDDFFDHGGGGGGGVVLAAEELFGGLLAIGTLGIGPEPIDEGTEYEVEDPFTVAGAETPRFGPPVAAAADLVAVSPELEKVLAAEEAAATESDLMMVSAELEKVLAAEVADKGGVGGGDAAGHRVSSARTSGAVACPLQGFLFGSPIEVAETAAAEGGRRERRASLGELFMRSRISDGGGAAGWKDEEGGGAADESGGGGGGGMHLMMKRMLKRRGTKGYGDDLVEVSTAESKFHKILQIFHRKIHPENSVAAKKLKKNKKQGNRDKGHNFLGNNTIGGGGGDGGGSGAGSGENRMPSSKVACRKERMPSFRCCSMPALVDLDGGDSIGNREHWIKTDADYLVLEL